ncbi:MAG: hypothetical protein ACJ788_11920 [Ktedonobacteraceae bacterium]
MRVLQHYYTSYSNEETGSVGFQVKAMSPGISANLQADITRLISYRIPSSLNEQAIDTHPVALRYYYKGPDECILLCSQSIGNDINGRPGNFFAHTLIMEPEMFTSVPPILYWKSPFWRHKDTESGSQVASLPILSTFYEEPSLDIEDMWNFLAEDDRRALLYKLMCAVVHSNKTYQRIVILDTTENVVWWIMAVSCLLPPDYRPILSFATYHHDPYQGQYLITGTTSDSSFRASAQDYISYFILNAEAGTTSAVEDSLYAKMAVEAAQPDLYETQLLALFTDYTKRFPTPTSINEQLDRMALYAKLLNSRNESALSPEELEVIHIALSSFEELRDYAQEDIDELHRLQQVLSQASQQNSAIYKEHERVLALLKRHKVQSGEFVQNELKGLVEQFFQQNGSELAAIRLSQLHKTYNKETLVASINHPAYIQWLTRFLEKGTSQQLRLVWQYIGGYIQPGEQSQSLLITSLRVVDRLWSDQRIEEENGLLATIWQALAGHEQAWLQLAADSSTQLPQGVLEIFYYNFAYPLDLDQRVPYRNIVSPVSSIILEYEINWDVYNAGVQDRLAKIELWIKHAKHWQYDTMRLLVQGLSQLQKNCSPQEWQELAPKILTNSLLAPLPTILENQLVNLALSRLSISQFSLVDIELYKRYQNHASLTEEVRTTIAAILAVVSGHMDTRLAQQLYQQVKMLLPEEYQTAIKQCIPEFFQHTVTNEAHCCLIAAFFTWNHGYATYFWQTYWETFAGKLMYPRTAGKAADLLAFWFAVSPTTFRQPYIVQNFFLMLPSTLENLQKSYGFQEVICEFNVVAASQTWYPALQDFFLEKKSILGAIGQSLVMQFQRGRGNQKAGKEAEDKEAQRKEASAQEFAAGVAKLFERKQALERHRQLSKLYSGEFHEQFWSYYWQGFIDLMTSRDANLSLTLLSFWFDESFEILGHLHYAPQEFFLGLSAALERACKERGFRETASQINEKVLQQIQGQYRWYSLVKNLFSV